MYVIHANLDAEARWGHRTLPAAVATRASYYAALTAALAPADSAIEVWAPAEIDPARLCMHPAWRVPSMRTGTPPCADLVWAPRTSRAANDRRVALQLAVDLGVALPGATVVSSTTELSDVVASLPQWVAKAPLTTAGRDRARDVVVASKLLAHFGALVVEPWCERIFDVGLCGTIVDERVELEEPHTLLSTPRGGFAGISLAPPPLTSEELASLQRVARAAGTTIAALGHRGPFAVDAFVYNDNGTRRLHPICEINARCTFGTVARALGERGVTQLLFVDPPGEATPLITPVAGVGAWVV